MTACKPCIATPEEVLEVFTQVMHSDKPSEQLKAAEQMAKYHGLFTPKESSGYSPALIGEIEAEVQAIALRRKEQEDAAQRGH